MAMYPTPEWLAERNIASWRDIVGFYEDFVARPNWDFLSPLLRLVRQIVETDTARSFRAGQSLWHLMISTADQHGLKADEPFVVVTLVENGQMFELEYRERIGGRVVENQRCSEPQVLAHLDRMLGTLWANTRRR